MPMDIRLRDRVEMKKPHPCGEKIFEITRVGMDVKLRCTGCGHEVMLPRAKAEKGIKKILERVTRTTIVSNSHCGHCILVWLLGYINDVTRTNSEICQILFRDFAGEYLDLELHGGFIDHGGEYPVNELVHEIFVDDTLYCIPLSFLQHLANGIKVLFQIIGRLMLGI